MQGWFEELTESVRRACGITELPNCCNANFYEDGSQSVGWHADDEALFDATHRDALIVSLSLGATRSFELRPNDSIGEVTRLRLQDGDLCTMEGLVQKHYRHRVPTDAHTSEPRINLTWRWIVRHDSSCPSRGSSVGRTLSPLVVDLVDEEEESGAAGRRRQTCLSEVSAEEIEKRRKRELRFATQQQGIAKRVRLDEQAQEGPPDAAKANGVKPDEEDKRAKAEAKAEAEVNAEVKAEARAVEAAAPSIAVGGLDSLEKRRARAERFGMPLKAAKGEEAETASTTHAGSARAGPAGAGPDGLDRWRARGDRFSTSAREPPARAVAAEAGERQPRLFAAERIQAAAALVKNVATALKAESEAETRGALGSARALAAAVGSGGRWRGPDRPNSDPQEEERRRKREERFKAAAAPSAKADGGASKERAGAGGPVGPSGITESTPEEERRRLRAQRFAKSS